MLSESIVDLVDSSMSSRELCSLCGEPSASPFSAAVCDNCIGSLNLQRRTDALRLGDLRELPVGRCCKGEGYCLPVFTIAEPQSRCGEILLETEKRGSPLLFSIIASLMVDALVAAEAHGRTGALIPVYSASRRRSQFHTALSEVVSQETILSVSEESTGILKRGDYSLLIAGRVDTSDLISTVMSRVAQGGKRDTGSSGAFQWCREYTAEECPGSIDDSEVKCFGICRSDP